MADYMPTTNDDASRQQLVSQAFYFVGDLLAGSDSAQPAAWSVTRADGLLGTPTNGTDVQVGANGDIFVRGRSGLYARQPAGTPAAAATAQAAGLTVPPVLLLLGLFLLLRR